MGQNVDQLTDLGQGQRVRLTFGDGGEIEARVNQISYTPDDHLRLELSENDERYQLRSVVEDGEWTAIEVRQRDSDAWTALGDVTDVRPGETFRTVKSDDMDAQEDTGATR